MPEDAASVLEQFMHDGVILQIRCAHHDTSFVGAPPTCRVPMLGLELSCVDRRDT